MSEYVVEVTHREGEPACDRVRRFNTESMQMAHNMKVSWMNKPGIRSVRVLAVLEHIAVRDQQNNKIREFAR